ncbi:MAG TPA: cytochrome c3 family protein [Anaeromyxobacteraceae bacterium]|nr:cytochrome c3 family protein [Anaeromyxobacteraceae bacterium]
MRSLALATLFLAAPSLAAASGDSRFVPLPPEQAVSTHGPFEMGACTVCHHPRKGEEGPGPVLVKTNALCFECHEEFKKPVGHHPAGHKPCLSCHSPHNARKKSLLF